MQRIVKRAFGQYTDVAVIFGYGALEAITLCEQMERENRDGEYLIRGMDQPNWEPPTHCKVQEAFAYL